MADLSRLALGNYGLEQRLEVQTVFQAVCSRLEKKRARRAFDNGSVTIGTFPKTAFP